MAPVPPAAAPDTPRDIAERAWELRSSDPARAAVLVEALVEHDDDGTAAMAGAALGYACLRTGAADRAEAVLSCAVVAADRAAEPIPQARVQVALGALHMSRGSYAEAVGCMNKADIAFARGGDPAGRVGTLVNRGLAFRHLGDHARALHLLGKATERFRDLEDRYGEAVALVNTVQIYRELGNEAAAVPLADRAWEVAQALDQPAFRTYVQATCGAILAATGNIELGQRMLEEAAQDADKLGLPAVRGEALGNLALIAVAEDPERARALLAPALDAVRSAGDPWSVCRALLALGACAARPAQAREAYEQAIDLASARGAQVLLRLAHRGAADVCERLGDTEAALSHWRSAAEATDRLSADHQEQRLARVEVAIAHRELRARASRARQRIAELVAIGRAHTDLLTMLSHDLRTPVTSTMLLADELLARDPTADTRQMVSRILSNQQRMARVLDAVRVDAAAEHGQLELVRRDEDLLQLVDLIAGEHREAAESKRQWLQVEGAPVRVQVDAERLFHPISNLLDNAIKYSPPRSAIVARVLRIADGARVEIHDRGPGVNAEQATSLFEPFARGAARPTGGERSTGLGLYIARRMIELHGGRIGAGPGQDKTGACFWFELPEHPRGDG